jgi:hypothetical protein
VLIEHRATGKVGIAVVHNGTRRVTILGAGSAGDVPMTYQELIGGMCFGRKPRST